MDKRNEKGGTAAALLFLLYVLYELNRCVN